MKRALLTLKVLGIILFLAITTTHAQTPQEIAEIGRTSSVSLTMDKGSTGSGFFVLPDQIVTCYHVIEEASSGYISPVLQPEEKYSIVGITAIDKDNDLVILKVSGVRGIPLGIGNKEAKIQDQIYVVGDPLGIPGNVTDGKITNIFANRLLMDANISPGNSGGAVLNTKSEVIGVVTASVGAQDAKGQDIDVQNLNIAVPSKYLAPLVENARVPSRTIKPLSVDGVTARHLAKLGPGTYVFTVHNQRAETISNLHCLIIFKDNKGVICSDQFKLRRSFFAGQVRRVLHSPPRFDELLPAFSKDSKGISIPIGPRAWQLMTDYEIRILDFGIGPDVVTRGWGKTLVPLGAEEVSGSKFTWTKSNPGDGFFYFLQNHSYTDIKDISAYVVFYDKQGDPITESDQEENLEIPAMGTLKVEGTVFDFDVKQLTKRVEFRIFQVH